MGLDKETRLFKAREALYRYRFNEAYAMYRQVYSSMAFQVDPLLLEHLGHFVRVLYELGRTQELSFYLPILERHYEQSKSPLAAYALAYAQFCLSQHQKSKTLFLSVLTGNAEGDLRSKALMMLAKLADSDDDRIQFISQISSLPQDPMLQTLYQVWQGLVLSYQGRFQESINSLNELLATLDGKQDWYGVISIKDALVRIQLRRLDFDAARSAISTFRTTAAEAPFRTIERHIGDLNQVYFNVLGQRTVQVTSSKQSLVLSHRNMSVQIRQSSLHRMVGIFAKNSTVTMRKLSNHLEVSHSKVEGLLLEFSEKLLRLSLPEDSLNYLPKKVALIPALAFEGDKTW